jgi:catechol 2,3-dioxygenase-like lactoylglutathione lyase family enzyme
VISLTEARCSSRNLIHNMKVAGIHHVAYRCNDARETVVWYERMLKMRFVLAISENEVPSTKAPEPYRHVFLDAGQGNVLAFFELPSKDAMSFDPNTPNWVQHIAFNVEDFDMLISFKLHLESNNVDVLGVTDHGIFRSIYFFDPNGHRLELACNCVNVEDKLNRLDDVRWDMLDEWTRTKRAPKHSAFLHSEWIE